MTASEAEVDEALTAALQRSHSTPEPLFGHAHLDFTNSSGLNQHDLLPNGNKNEYGKRFCFKKTGKSLLEDLIFASTNPQYDDRLFIELQVQYMKSP